MAWGSHFVLIVNIFQRELCKFPIMFSYWNYFLVYPIFSGVIHFLSIRILSSACMIYFSSHMFFVFLQCYFSLISNPIFLVLLLVHADYAIF